MGVHFYFIWAGLQLHREWTHPQAILRNSFISGNLRVATDSTKVPKKLFLWRLLLGNVQNNLLYC